MNAASGCDSSWYCIVRQLEQQVRSILDAIAVDETRKRELIRGEAVDKAEQLRKCIIHQHREVVAEGAPTINIGVLLRCLYLSDL